MGDTGVVISDVVAQDGQRLGLSVGGLGGAMNFGGSANS